jgi:acetyltransferase-like isoleucine patch superfamily enzyme
MQMKEIIFMFFGYKQEYRFMKFIKYLQYRIFQKVFGINYKVPWPVHWSSIVTHSKNIKFNKELIPLGYSPGCYIQARNGIVIGSNVLIASGVKIISSNHELIDYTKYTKNKPIIIGDNCWIGANCVILPGVELGEHTIVAAGSVESKSFPRGNCIIGGIPAKKIKDIEPYIGENFLLNNSKKR